MASKIVNVLQTLIHLLNVKEQVVISKRYGLVEGGEMSTLAQLGVEYGVTRERIRQIQDNAVRKLKRTVKTSELHEFLSWFEFELESNGGLISEVALADILVEKFKLNNVLDLNFMKFSCMLSEKVRWEHNKVDYEPHFRFESITFANIASTICSVVVYLKNANKVESLNVLYKNSNVSKGMSIDTFKSILSLNRKLVVDSRGVSLVEWRFVNPKTLYDKILFVLNDTKEPLHFSEIAKKIESYGFDSKLVSTQAVHNELINNPIFVLIGRGIYALKTWGYKEGTVSDVIESILSKSGPMHLYDLTKEVLQRRKVKSVTVQINLNSKKSKFRKNREGMYELAN